MFESLPTETSLQNNSTLNIVIFEDFSIAFHFHEWNIEEENNNIKQHLIRDRRREEIDKGEDSLSEEIIEKSLSSTTSSSSENVFEFSQNKGVWTNEEWSKVFTTSIPEGGIGLELKSKRDIPQLVHILHVMTNMIIAGEEERYMILRENHVCGLGFVNTVSMIYWINVNFFDE
ncbi:hypothetical protein ABK040_002227 [Willaertia magna]